MGYESIMCDLSGAFRRSDFEKTKVFGSGLYVLYCATDCNEKLLRNVAAKHHVYFDAGINFLKFEWSTNNVLDEGCLRVVDDEYVKTLVEIEYCTYYFLDILLFIVCRNYDNAITIMLHL